ncbi:MAG TPA: DUF433 domain-containing protein [Chloroflexota bacterium]|nr:DUF433 domain-containing protein [Chloroflexota bacterium]
MNQKDLILSDPAIMMGKPVIAGTRITVELILERLAAGELVADLLTAYPRLTEEAIRAAVAFTDVTRLHCQRLVRYQSRGVNTPR